MKRKSNQFSVRLDPDLLKEVEECSQLTGLDPAVFMREAFKAFVAEVREKGEIRLPLAVVPKKQPLSPFPSTASSGRQTSSLNDPPTNPAVPKSDAASEHPRMTKTRAILRQVAAGKNPTG